jgi:hypothetical protein
MSNFQDFGRAEALGYIALGYTLLPQGFTDFPATRHPGQVQRFVMVSDKWLDASRDPEDTAMIEIMESCHTFWRERS